MNDAVPTNEEFILLGDLNARVGKDLILVIKQRFNEEGRNEIRDPMRNKHAKNKQYLFSA